MPKNLRPFLESLPVIFLPYTTFITRGFRKTKFKNGLPFRDTIQPLEKLGIYELNCNDCNLKIC